MKPVPRAGSAILLADAQMRHGSGRLQRQLQHVDGAQGVLADDLLLHLGRALGPAPAVDGPARGDGRVEGIGPEQARDEGRIFIPHEGLDVVEEDAQRLLAVGHLPELGQEAHHLDGDAHGRAVQVEPGQDRVRPVHALERASHQPSAVADIGEVRQLLDDASQSLEIRFYSKTVIWSLWKSAHGLHLSLYVSGVE